MILSLGLWRTGFWCPLLVPVYKIFVDKMLQGEIFQAWCQGGDFKFLFWERLCLPAWRAVVGSSSNSQTTLGCQRTHLTWTGRSPFQLAFLSVPVVTWYLKHLVKTVQSHPWTVSTLYRKMQIASSLLIHVFYKHLNVYPPPFVKIEMEWMADIRVGQ